MLPSLKAGGPGSTGVGEGGDRKMGKRRSWRDGRGRKGTHPTNRARTALEEKGVIPKATPALHRHPGNRQQHARQGRLEPRAVVSFNYV